MTPPMQRTVSRKLLSVALLTTLVAVVLAIAAISAYFLRADYRNLAADLRTQAELVGHMSAPALAFHDRTLARNNLNLLRLRPEVLSAIIYDAEGRVFASYTAPNQALRQPATLEGDTVRMDGNELSVFTRIVQDQEMLGTVHLRVDHELFDRLIGLGGIGALVTVLAMGVAYLLSTRLQKVVTAPILSIADIARGVVERRDYSRRAQKVSDDEVGMLADSFNDMLSEIQKRTEELERSNHDTEREVAERGRAQQEVMRLNTELELRVRERTLQLEASNDQLSVAKAVADEANQAKSEFLSSMSHELRTPLNAILGFAQLLDSDSMPVSPEKRHEYLAHILKAGKHLLVLINEVLDLAKVESGTLSLSLEPVNLADVFRECREMIEPTAVQRRVRLVFTPPATLNVVADRTRLKQVLLNLLSNAVKYNREGGSVVVGAAPAGVCQVRVSVQDTGKGLDRHQQSLLFQPFNRLGQEAGPEEGTGIGLVLTKRLVELMGGQIGLSSTVDVGSVFWFELDASAGVARAPSSGDDLGADDGLAMVVLPDGVKTVLYVEDNPANLRLVEEIVALRTDLRLISAADGGLGVTMAQSHAPAVVLMDLNLPGIGGLDALKMLRRDPRTAHIPVIALTANAMPRDVESGLAQGFFRYLTKPLDVRKFLEALDAALAEVS
ncbi:ATP-binding protein [Rhizobacter sp. Root1221]|uniref:ATP-binding protein n=1 Tax=Rhizobacter sp. Root1221 TaxID=1736433 RepID=UPI000AA3C1D4|nr:ATP-binding protein [Rhizobacter sp. Root1221]